MTAEAEILEVQMVNGLKCFESLLKSLNGSSEIRSAFPSGHSTSLLINTIVAADCRALS